MRPFTFLFIALIICTSNIEAQQKPIHLNGKFLNPETLKPISEEYYSDAQFHPYNELIAVEKRRDGGWVLFNYQLEEIEGSWNKEAHVFSEGITIVRADGLIANRHTAINDKGEIVFTKSAADISNYNHGLAFFKTDNGLYGIIDKKGKEIIKPQKREFKKTIKIDNKIYHIAREDLTWGIVDSRGKEVIKFIYGGVYHIKDDIFSLGFVDKENPTSKGGFGSTVTNYLYQLWSLEKNKNITPELRSVNRDNGFDDFDQILVLKKGESVWSLIDLEGNTVFAYESDLIRPISENLIAIGKMEEGAVVAKYAISDLQGNQKSQFNISHIGLLENGLIPICITEGDRTGCGFVDENVQVRIPLTYTESVHSFQENGTAIVVNGYKKPNDYWVIKQRGVIDKTGRVLVPPVFGEIEQVSDKYYKVNLPNNAHDVLIGINDVEPIEYDSKYIYKAYARYYGQINNLEKAKQYFEKTPPHMMKPEDEYALGMIYKNLGELQKAAQAFTKAIDNSVGQDEKKQVNIAASVEYADVLFALGQIEEGKSYYEEILEKVSRTSIVKLRYADALRSAKMDSEAITYYKEVLNDFNFLYSGEIHAKLGVAQLTVKDVEESIGSFNKAIQYSKDKRNPYFYRGQAHALNNDYDKAIADYQKSIELNGGELSTVHKHLAEVYDLNGDASRACEVWKQLAPYDEPSKGKVKEKCQ
ncbi:MAG: tetratricopeptide repeat protein [Balneolaceae bacterium]|nr:tetratricopeptide repeat protein [Balneolaceae bacterium]MBO6546092.1 tetratricopeptide repeat protein [Balneolaceae bacterium]MBO6647488.1 tetratricopeptide repeat protein [Balneolaceae bacterium]